MGSSVEEIKDYQATREMLGDREWDIPFEKATWAENPHSVYDRSGELLGYVRRYTWGTYPKRHHWCAYHPEDGKLVFSYGKSHVSIKTKHEAIAYLCYDRLMGD